jgi:hypothetical protein
MAAMAPPADPAQKPASTENNRPDFAIIFQITTDATKNDIWSGWVANPGETPMLIGGYSREWADPDLAEAIITMRHGKPRRIAVIDFDEVHTLEQAEAAATEAAAILRGGQ